MTLGADDDFRRERLRAIEDAILAATGNVRERMVALDAMGHEVSSKTGVGNEIELTPAELALMAGSVDLITHNHDDSSPFSVEDLAVAALVQAREVNAFGRAVRWRLIRRGSVWPAVRLVAQAFTRTDRRVQRELFEWKKRGAFSGDPFRWADRGGHVWVRLEEEHPEWFTVMREERSP